MTNWNELRDRAYKNACEHGWHDEDWSDEHFLCLIISELMEAVQADRKGRCAYVDMFKRLQEHLSCLPCDFNDRIFKEGFEKYIKDSYEDELCDACIRLFDIAGLRNLNFNRFASFNIISKKGTFMENIYAIVRDIANNKHSLEKKVNYALSRVMELANIFGIDLLWFIEQKMRYNELLEYKHGCKY